MIAYILLRTSNRPKFFKNCMDSIKAQDYPKIVTIVHSDDVKDKYVTGDIIIRAEREPKSKGNAPYNLYNNTLLQAIPDDKQGYYFFVDDDDMYYDSTVISKAMKSAKRDCINVVKVQRWNETIWPKTWRGQKSFQTECFFLHTDHKNRALWWAQKGGDHYYSKQLTGQLQINWIEDLIICKAQEGKGNGKRFDLGERPARESLYTTRPAAICLEDVRILYLKDVKTPYPIRGNKGEIRTMQRMRAERLAMKGKVRILKEEVAVNG